MMDDDEDWGDGGLWQEAHERAEAAAAARRSVIDRFFLAVIDKHPVEGSSREKRLADAKKALLGIPKARGPVVKGDHPLLMEMAHAYVSERCELELRIPDEELMPIVGASSIRELARKAAQHDHGQSLASTEDRLRRKFSSEKGHFLRMALHEVERRRQLVQLRD